MKNLVSVGISVCLLFSSVCAGFSYTEKNYEYIDFNGTESIEAYPDGYVFNMTNGECIYLDEYGEVTEKAPEARDTNIVLTVNDGVPVTRGYTYDRKLIFELPTELTQCEENQSIISVIKTDVNSEKERKITVYSKADGTILSKQALADYAIPQENRGYASFSEDGFRAFEGSNGKYGIIDIYGRVTAEPQYEQLFLSGKGSFKAKKDGCWRFITSDNTLIKEFVMDVENIDTVTYPYGSTVYYIRKNGRRMPLDKDFKPMFRNADSFDIYSVAEDKVGIVRDASGEKYGLISLDGQLLMPIEYDSIIPCGSGFLSVGTEGDISVANLDGKILAGGLFYCTGVGDNGLMGISHYDEAAGRYVDRYIDSLGNTVLELPQDYYVQGAFHEGKAAVVTNIIFTRFGDVSYIDESGKTVLEPADGDTNSWTKGGDFKNNIAVIGTGLGKGGPFGGLLIRYTGGTPSDWAQASVASAKSCGYPPEELCDLYRNKITRGEFCELAAAMLDCAGALSEDAKNAANVFPDTDSRSVAALNYLGVVNGISAWSRGLGNHTYFEPDGNISREQAAKILDRIYDIMYGEGSGRTASVGTYTDDGEISDWAKPYVYSISERGIMNGTDAFSVNGTEYRNFSPFGGYTREEAIVTMQRLFDLSEKTHGEAGFCISDADGKEILTAADVGSCSVTENESGKSVLTFVLTDEGRERFSAETERISLREDGESYIRVSFGGKTVSEPRISAPISSGTFSVTGDFTKAQAEEMAALFK